MFVDISGVWCIEPNAAREYLRVYAAIIARREAHAPLTDAQKAEIEAATGKQLRNTSGSSTQGAVGIIRVSGPITKRGNLLSEISGATSVDSLRAAFDALNADPEVAGILMDFDSPGGHINGIADFAEHVRTAKTKPVAAYSDGMMASAAYWIGSAADQIIISKTAQVGSIGAVMRFEDDTKLKNNIGIEDVEILDSNAPLKSENHRDDEVRAHLQQAVNDAGDAFRTAVAKHRGVSLDTVRTDYGRGGIMVGKRALQAGLADRISTFDQIVKELSSGTLKMVQPQSKQLKSEVGVMGVFEDFLVSHGWKQPSTDAPQEPTQAARPAVEGPSAADRQREIDLQAQLAEAQAKMASYEAELAAARKRVADESEAQRNAQIAAFQARFEGKVPPAALTEAQAIYAATLSGEAVTPEAVQAMLDKVVETSAGMGPITGKPNLHAVEARTPTDAPETEVVDAAINKFNAERGHKAA